MRSYLLIPILMVLYAGPSCASSANALSDLTALEQAWHSCVRDVYARQPPLQSTLAAQRSALDECKDYEDTYVMAILAVQIAEEETQWQRERSASARAAAGESYVAVYVIDPLSSWVRAWKR